LDCNAHQTVDLHIHSTASDGTWSPVQILEQAEQAGLGAIAITDHDTLEGARRAQHRSERIPFLAGIEISAAYPAYMPGNGSLHILGYGIRVDDATLNQNLAQLQASRRDRNPQIIKQLNRIGIGVTMADARAASGNDQIGRPHIARALVNGGWVNSIDEAFDRYLATGKTAYVDKARISTVDTISMIRAAGGVAVMAHPCLLTVSQGPAFESALKRLVDNGIEGLEVFYPRHDASYIAYCRSLARKWQLLMTGGSDFHGSITPHIQIGDGDTPYACYQKLRDKLNL